MTLLSMVQEVAEKCLKTNPATVTQAIGNADLNIQQIVQMINEDGQQLSSSFDWQALRAETSFGSPGAVGGILTFGALTGGAGYASGLSSTYSLVTLTGGHGSGAIATVQVTNGVVQNVSLGQNTPGAGYLVGDVLSASNAQLGGTGAGFQIIVGTIGIVGTQNQGNILTLTGPDFNFVVNETMWDRTTRRPVFGPKSAAEWQQLSAQQMQGPWWQFTLRGNQLLFIPAPTPGDSIYFEWISRYWATDTTGANGKSIMTVDTDVSKLNEQWHILGAIWRFKANAGLPYSKDQDKYDGAIADACTRDGVRSRINMLGAQADLYPGIVVPAGNWSPQ
jgi:hypothetical protein